jgi:ribosomal protein L12E/L44/L45/RPP1/RPP2
MLWLPFQAKRRLVINKVNAGEADVTKILQATGQPVNAEEVKKVVSTLKGKKLEDVYMHRNSAH